MISNVIQIYRSVLTVYCNTGLKRTMLDIISTGEVLAMFAAIKALKLIFSEVLIRA